MMGRKSTAIWTLMPLLISCIASGCYVLKQACGELRILAGMRRIEDALADPEVPARVKEKLRLVLEVREFGESEMGLARTGNYTCYYDTGGSPVAILVSGCRKDRFEPYTWWFPIVGTVPYKGFFDPEDAAAEADRLEEEGYDVACHEVSAFSTLGWFKDPIFSSALEYPDEEIAALVLHELAHATVWIPGETDFNEGLASFVGRQGAVEFMRRRHGAASREYERAVLRFAAAEERDARAREMFKRLDDLYRSDTPREEKLGLRDLVAGEPVNNAEILMRLRYGRYDEFRLLFERSGGDWKAFFDAARMEAEIASDDP